MHRYWLIKHLITRINSSGLHWRGALLAFNVGPLLPCPLFSLSLASLPPFYFGVYLLLAPFLAKPDPMEHTSCTSYPPSTRLVQYPPLGESNPGAGVGPPRATKASRRRTYY